MTRTTQTARSEFVAIMTRELSVAHPFLAVVHAAELLMRHGATYARIQEDWCNREMSERETARVERKEQLLEKRITEICADIGAGAIFSGDPRGATVKITVPSGYANDWGREGICVPTS